LAAVYDFLHFSIDTFIEDGHKFNNCLAQRYILESRHDACDDCECVSPFVGISSRNMEKLYTHWSKMAERGVKKTHIPDGIYSRRKNRLESEFAWRKRKSL